MRLMTPTLDTGAGPPIIRADALPQGCERRLHPRQHFPHIVDANKHPVFSRRMITLRLRSCGFATEFDFVVVQRLAVPVLQGIRLINRLGEGLFPRRQRLGWSNDASVPILSCTACGKG